MPAMNLYSCASTVVSVKWDQVTSRLCLCRAEPVFLRDADKDEVAGTRKSIVGSERGRVYKSTKKQIAESHSQLGLLSSLFLPLFCNHYNQFTKTSFLLGGKEKIWVTLIICIILKLLGSFKSITGRIFI